MAKAAQSTPPVILDESTVSAIARKTQTPVEVVRHLYDEELAELRSNSAVKSFLNIIAGRRVKERLREPPSRRNPPRTRAP